MISRARSNARCFSRLPEPLAEVLELDALANRHFREVAAHVGRLELPLCESPEGRLNVIEIDAGLLEQLARDFQLSLHVAQMLHPHFVLPVAESCAKRVLANHANRSE